MRQAHCVFRAFLVLLCWCKPAAGYWDDVTEKWIPELVYMTPAMSSFAGGKPMVLIWLDMQTHITNPVSPRVKLASKDPALMGEAYMMQMRHAKQDIEQIDFRRYMVMEPEENAKLVARYSNASKYTIVEVSSPEIQNFAQTAPFEMFLLTTGIYAWLMKPPCWQGSLAHQIRPENYACNMTQEELSDKSNAWNFLMYRMPRILDVFPLQGPSVGGTLISIMGEHLPNWSGDSPMIKVLANGLEQHLTPHYVSDTLVTFYTAPQEVPAERATVKSQIFYSPDRGRFFKCGTFEVEYYDDTRIRWGDVIAIGHVAWSEHVLHSQSSKWHSGSHQNIVMAKPETMDDTNKLWMITAAYGAPPAESGSAVVCGSTMRLLHVRTMQNLHTNFYSALASKQGQVYSVANSDEGDDWVLHCEPNTKHGFSWKWDNLTNRYDLFAFDQLAQKARITEMLAGNDRFWRPSTVFKLYHPMTEKYLTLPGDDASPEACAVCGEAGMKELTTIDGTDGDTQRFRIKRQTRVPMPCSSTELLAKRWQIATKQLEQGDFVAWRFKSDVPCIISGPLPVQQTNYESDTHFGQVVQVIEQTSSVQVEEWKPSGNLFSDTHRGITSTPQKNLLVLGKHSVHGPLVAKSIPCPENTPFEHRFVCLNGEAFCNMPVWRLFNLTFQYIGVNRSCVRLYIERTDIPTTVPLIEQVEGVKPR